MRVNIEECRDKTIDRLSQLSRRKAESPGVTDDKRVGTIEESGIERQRLDDSVKGSGRRWNAVLEAVLEHCTRFIERHLRVGVRCVMACRPMIMLRIIGCKGGDDGADFIHNELYTGIDGFALLSDSNGDGSEQVRREARNPCEIQCGNRKVLIVVNRIRRGEIEEVDVGQDETVVGVRYDDGDRAAERFLRANDVFPYPQASKGRTTCSEEEQKGEPRRPGANVGELQAHCAAGM